MPRPDGSIYVGRLPKSTRTRDLEEIFESYGRLMRCDIKYGAEMAYAFIDFEDRREAEDCVKYENGRELNGQAITVEWAKGGKDKRLGYDECFRCQKTGHWARECPDMLWGRRGGGGGGGGGRGRRRSPSPRRRRSRSRDRKRRSRSRSRSNERRRRSKSRERKRSRSQSEERKRSRSRSRSHRSRSESVDRKKGGRYKSGSRDRKRSPSGSKSKSRSKSRSRSHSPIQQPNIKPESQANGDSPVIKRGTDGENDDAESDGRRSRSVSRD